MDHKAFLLLIVHLLALGLSGADNHPSCFDDVGTCTDNMRKLMTDENMFWFGTDFIKACPPGSFIPTCTNSAPGKLSILARLYNTSDAAQLQKYVAVNSNIKLVDVTFPAKEGHYYGCGHTYHVSKATPFRLDPTKVTTLNSWRLDFVPQIRWATDASDAGNLYTVLVLDVGNFFLHGLYINAQGGDVQTGTPIKKYSGPRNTQTRPNVYLFAIIRQNGFISPGTAGAAVGKVMGMYMFQVPFAALSRELAGSFSDMVAANVLSVIGDAHSMERQKNSYIVNSCPFLITQSTALKNILNSANIRSSWTEEKVTLDYTEPSHLGSLTTDLSVEYSMPKDLVVESCCVKTTFTKTLYRPDPLGTHVARPAVTSRAPRINISPIFITTDLYDRVSSKTYTLMMVDMADSSSLMVHWMVTDIVQGDVSRGKEVLPYLGPNPLKSGVIRTYVFFLLKQTVDELDTSNLSLFASDACPSIVAGRCGFQLSSMMQTLDLEEISGITWLQAQQDAFARKRIYSDFMFMSMIDACDKQPGFEDPCPKQQYCPVTRANSGQLTTPAAGLSAVLVSFLTAAYCIARTV